jgi:biopolymer transport protein ExbB
VLWIDRVADLFVAGGAVMWPLAGAGLLLWLLLALRIFEVRRGAPVLHAPAELSRQVRTLLEADDATTERRVAELAQQGRHAVSELELALRLRRAGLERYARLIDTLVVAAPLLGLLGTVVGMMQTFDALTEMALFAQGGGIAGGISEALTTTQTGLLIALPALAVQRLLERLARRTEQRIEAVSAICRRWTGVDEDEQDEDEQDEDLLAQLQRAGREEVLA